MLIQVGIRPVVTDGGIEYMTAEREILTVLHGWDCHPRECFHDVLSALSAGYPDRPYYAFRPLLNHSGGGGVLDLYIPDDHPAALMAKLKWAGV
jgi:hypothetical protein